jgi:hypothetical protein
MHACGARTGTSCEDRRHQKEQYVAGSLQPLTPQPAPEPAFNSPCWCRPAGPIIGVRVLAARVRVEPDMRNDHDTRGVCTVRGQGAPAVCAPRGSDVAFRSVRTGIIITHAAPARRDKRDASRPVSRAP